MVSTLTMCQTVKSNSYYDDDLTEAPSDEDDSKSDRSEIPSSYFKNSAVSDKSNEASSCDKRKAKGLLVNKPFSNWVKLSSALNDHSKLKYHRDCLQLADTIQSSIENPVSGVDIMTDSTLQVKIKENEHILNCIWKNIHVELNMQVCCFNNLFFSHFIKKGVV